MDVNFKEVEAIANTLPIGLYAKRRIPTTISATATCSSYNPITDKIEVSYNQVAQSLKTAPDDWGKEVGVRSVLYHEVSHAILTNAEVINWGVTDQFNIFEDERIETIMNDYYLNVDFANSVYNINGIHSNADLTAPKSPMDYFYQIVRFHHGDADFIDRTKDIIKQYANLNGAEYDSKWWRYYDAVEKFYQDVNARFMQNNPNYDPNNPLSMQNQGQSSNGNGNSQGGNCPQSGGQGNSQGSSQCNGQNGSDGTNSDNGSQGSSYVSDLTGNKQDGQSGQSGQDRQDGQGGQGSKSNGVDKANYGAKTADSQNQRKEAFDISDAFLGEGGRDNSLRKVISKAFRPACDEDTYKQFDVIISNFNKKNNSGCALTGYSGVLNPRLVGNPNYKFFERKASVNGTNKFGSFHLNLFLDNSGSFSRNKEVVNGMIGALIRLEKRNKNFSFNVVHCGCGEELKTNPAEYGLTCNDGTSLDYDAIDIYRKLQKPSTYNYNIVLYDGSCYNSCYSDAFKAFNHNNCTIISDPSNEDEIRAYAPCAKAIITKQYTKNLLSNVMTTLERAFR